MIWYERVLNYEGELCPLTHLRTFSINVTIQKTNKTIELNFQMLVKFSTHCVSVKKERARGELLPFPDEGNQERYFSKERYNLSLNLPEILSALVEKQCYHTKYNRNFCTIEGLDSKGERVEYSVFFLLRKCTQGVEVFVESAYVVEYPSNKPRQKIKGFVLLGNIYRNKKIPRPR